MIALIRLMKARKPERERPMRKSQSVMEIFVMEEDRIEDPGRSRFMIIAIGRLHIDVQKASTGIGMDCKNEKLKEYNPRMTSSLT